LKGEGEIKDLSEGKKKILPSTGEVVAYGLTILGALLAIFALALLLRGKRKEK